MVEVILYLEDFAVVGVILYLEDFAVVEDRITLARINESLGEEVIGEGRDAIIGDVLEMRRVFLLYSVQLENIMEVHSIMDNENCSRRDADLLIM